MSIGPSHRPRLIAAALVALAFAGAPVARAADDPLLPAAGTCPGDNDPDAPHHLQRVAMHCVINIVRARAGRGLLRSNVVLRHSATYKARRIARCRIFSHHPCGDSLVVPFHEAQLDGRTRWFLGETLAWGIGSSATAHDVVRRWLASADHRRVLLDRRFFCLGVRRRRLALKGAPRGAVIWVAHLGTRRGVPRGC
jgi:uncharacterized protein YkwD